MNTITDDQIAEIERKVETKKSEGFLLAHNLSCADLLALIARLREAERDAKRLEWLIGEQCIVESQNGIGSPVVYRLFWRHLGECQAEWYPSERAAIDAAMQEAKQ